MSDAPTIRPALTPDEWTHRSADIPRDADAAAWTRVSVVDGGAIYVEELGPDGCPFVYIHPRARHALAALCLYGTPEGFTQEDVAALRELTLWVGHVPAIAPLANLAARIAALLPESPP